MNGWWLVGLGGAVGAVLRYSIGVAFQRALPQQIVPFGTLAVNVLGCLAIGYVAGWGDTRGPLSHEMRLLVIAGLLGGFTTFSSFGLEIHMLTRSEQFGKALLHIGLHMTVALAAVWVGFGFGSGTR